MSPVRSVRAAVTCATGNSGADERPPVGGIGRDDLGRCHAQRGVGRQVGDRASLRVVVADVSEPFEHLGSQLDQFGRRVRIVEPPDREGDGEVVDDRSPREHRGTPQRHAEASADGVVGVLARLQLQLRSKAVGDAQREPLVGPLIAEPRRIGLEAIDLARTVRSPRSGHVVGRLVVARVLSRWNRAETGAAIAALSTTRRNGWCPTPIVTLRATTGAAGRRRGCPRARATTPR